MPRVDFVITSDRHHAAMFRPVVEGLLGRQGYRCRLVSLCELRGLDTPTASFEQLGAEVLRVIPFHFRRAASAGRAGLPAPPRPLRRLVYPLAWYTLLGPRLAGWLDEPSDLVVVPNDAAFPYDFICARLRRRGVPFLLVQEGIRFPETVFRDPGITQQGRHGAAAVAAWGETSAEFFRQRGVPPERIHLTGNPRFDVIAGTDWRGPAAALARRLPPGEPTLLLLSNPIELWGFCTRQEKMALIRRLLVELQPLFDDSPLRLVIKLHGKESEDEFRQAYADLPSRDRIVTLGDAPLYPLLALARAAVTLGSTVGLEALLFGLRLAVLEVPGVGFLHDFVRGGGAAGLSWDRPMDEQLRPLVADQGGASATVAAYVARSLATRDRATERLVELVASLVSRPLAPAAGAGGG